MTTNLQGSINIILPCKQVVCTPTNITLREARKLPAFSDGSSELCVFITTLKAMTNAELFALYAHVFEEESGHPDDEFARFNLEGKVTDSEVLEALIAEHELRTRSYKT